MRSQMEYRVPGVTQLDWRYIENLTNSHSEKKAKSLMRLLFKKYQKSQTMSDQLTWSHYIELLTIEDDLERKFYEIQCINEKCLWKNLNL